MCSNAHDADVACGNARHVVLGSNARRVVHGSNAERVALGKLACSKRELVQVHSKGLVQVHSKGPELQRHSKELVQVHSKGPVQVHSRVLVLKHNKVLVLVHSKELVLVHSKVLELGSKVLEPAYSNESALDEHNAHALDDKPCDRVGLREGLGSKSVLVLRSSSRHHGRTGQRQLDQRLLQSSRRQPTS